MKRFSRFLLCMKDAALENGWRLEGGKLFLGAQDDCRIVFTETGAEIKNVFGGSVFFDGVTAADAVALLEQWRDRPKRVEAVLNARDFVHALIRLYVEGVGGLDFVVRMQPSQVEIGCYDKKQVVAAPLLDKKFFFLVSEWVFRPAVYRFLDQEVEQALLVVEENHLFKIFFDGQLVASAIVN